MDAETNGGTTVAGGPFQGMQLGPVSYFSSIYGKLMGVYERELRDIIEKIIQIQPEVIVDIGAAEGYYACGFAYRLKGQTKVVAYEADVCSRYSLKRNIQRNALEPYVEVRGACTPSDLQGHLGQLRGKTVIVCDAEGWEHELLDNETIPELRRAYILVELHDFYLPEIDRVFHERFNGTIAYGDTFRRTQF